MPCEQLRIGINCFHEEVVHKLQIQDDKVKIANSGRQGHTDSNLATLTRTVQYMIHRRVFTGVKSVKDHKTELEKGLFMLR
jgi:hypothetical protein